MDFIIENGKKIILQLLKKFFDYSKNKISNFNKKGFRKKLFKITRDS